MLMTMASRQRSMIRLAKPAFDGSGEELRPCVQGWRESGVLVERPQLQFAFAREPLHRQVGHDRERRTKQILEPPNPPDRLRLAGVFCQGAEKVAGQQDALHAVLQAPFSKSSARRRSVALQLHIGHHERPSRERPKNRAKSLGLSNDRPERDRDASRCVERPAA